MKFVIPPAFNGPPTTGNGGISAGLLAAFYGDSATVEVTLRQPPPLDTEITVVDGPDGTLDALDGDRLVMAATLTDALLEPVPSVSLATAREASTRFDGLTEHPFPTCFVCGTARPDHDGFQVWPGAVDPSDRTYVAAPWVATPQPTCVDVWGALDCPGGWSVDLLGRRAVLGRMAARVEAVPAGGEDCVVVAKCDGWEGRKAFSRTSLYGSNGALLATSKAVWIQLP